MEQRLSGGELTANPDADAASVDRLSTLPNDVLLRILLRLEDAAAAGRTSVLASCWRRLWTLLPELRFSASSGPRAIASALAAHEAVLTRLDVAAEDAAAESVAAWLPAAACRLSGSLTFTNLVPEKKNANDGGQKGVFDLTCLENATTVTLDLGCLGVAVPSAGVFTRLTELSLSNVHLRGPCALGDAVSSRRCPCLEKLIVRNILGMSNSNLTILSSSLRHMVLAEMRGLEKLTIVTPALEYLTVLCCFYQRPNQLVADISARQLKVLRWGSWFDRRSIKFDKMKHLETVCPNLFFVYGFSPNNVTFREFLLCFKVIRELCLKLVYPPDIDNLPYSMEDMKTLPDIQSLDLSVTANGHATGTSLFHVLKKCSGIKKLYLELSSPHLEKQTACPPGCVCGQQPNWKTKQLLLNRLQEVDEVTELRGSEDEVTFLKQLFSWATVLKKMTITFKSLVTESIVKELCLVLRSFSRPEICMEFYMYKDKVKVLYAPEDLSTSLNHLRLM